MSLNNRVIWSEGLFLRPEHFQQQDRYVETLIEGRCAPMRPFSWGFRELELDHQLLTVGKIGIRSAKGIFPDGTPFDIPNEFSPPPPLEISSEKSDTIVHLGVSVRRPGGVEVSSTADAATRYAPRECEALDSTVEGGTPVELQVANLQTRLLLDEDRREDFSCLGIAHVVEARSDRNIIVDESFIVPAVGIAATPRIVSFLNELEGLLHHRGEALAGRLSQPGRAAAEIADFLLLQATNRFEPLVAHLVRQTDMHPEELYRILVEMAGELSTFTAPAKRPPQFPPYKHDALRETYDPVMRELRESLSMVLEQSAIALPLVEKRYGIRVSTITDRSLLDSATFVLAVKADLPTEDVRKRFARQTKVGPVEEIRDLVNSQIPGVDLNPLAVAPRQIPYHAGCVYFELDPGSRHWASLKRSGGFALHVAGDFPGLDLEFWAIRR